MQEPIFEKALRPSKIKGCRAFFLFLVSKTGVYHILSAGLTKELEKWGVKVHKKREVLLVKADKNFSDNMGVPEDYL